MFVDWYFLNLSAALQTSPNSPRNLCLLCRGTFTYRIQRCAGVRLRSRGRSEGLEGRSPSPSGQWSGPSTVLCQWRALCHLLAVHFRFRPKRPTLTCSWRADGRAIRTDFAQRLTSVGCCHLRTWRTQVKTWHFSELYTDLI